MRPVQILGRPLVVTALLLASLPLTAAAQSVAIERVTVIDVRTGARLPRQTVLITAGRITRIGPAAAVRAPARAQRVAGDGAFLIPGLWDMHTHLTIAEHEGEGPLREPYDRLSAALLSSGVTGVRDMAGDLAVLRQWRDSTERGLLFGPRLVITGGKLGESPAVPGASAAYRSPADVDSAIAALRRGGADFVKLGNAWPDMVPPTLERAAAARLVVAGHVPTGMSAVSLARLGLRSIEHMTGMLLASSREEAELVPHELALLGREPVGVVRRGWRKLVGALGLWRPMTPEELRRRQLASFDSLRADTMALVLREHGTFVTPTLLVLQDIARDTALGRRAAYPYLLKLVRILRARGVPLLAGTDIPSHPFGTSLHEELAMFVREAGFSPLEALRTATLAPGAYFGGDTLGTVEPGRVADLVLLDADPLSDITNVGRIRAVVVRGRVVRGAELEALRARGRRPSRPS